LEFLPYDNAVVDILIHKSALDGDDSSDSSNSSSKSSSSDEKVSKNQLRKLAQIIEINPFFGDTGACLFSWRDQSDVGILKNGPFQLRLREQQLEAPYTALPWEWGTWVMEYRGVPRKSNKSRDTKAREQKNKNERNGRSYTKIVGVAVVAVVVLVVLNFLYRDGRGF